MADVKWIKITTDIFDDEKILLIESLPDAYAIITVWFKLLCLAGKQNNSGVFMLGQMPYTDKMLSTIFRMKESTITMALQVFEQFGMVELIDGVITIPNWGKHQSLDQLESKKEYMRNYMKGYREKQKALTDGKPNCKTNSKANVRKAEEERDKNKNKKKNKEEEGEKKEEATDCFQIADLFNSLCPSLSPVKILSDAIKTDLNESMDKYSLDDFNTLFSKAEASDFLKGKNRRKWAASFDWLIKDENIAKVLNGNFDNRAKPEPSYDIKEVETAFFLNEDYKPSKTAAEDESVRIRAEALKQELAEKY